MDRKMDRNEFQQRLFAAWACFPQFRFGQFLENVLAVEDAFYLEDEEIVVLAEKYARDPQNYNRY